MMMVMMVMILTTVNGNDDGKDGDNYQHFNNTYNNN